MQDLVGYLSDLIVAFIAVYGGMFIYRQQKKDKVLEDMKMKERISQDKDVYFEESIAEMKSELADVKYALEKMSNALERFIEQYHDLKVEVEKIKVRHEVIK